MNYFLFQLLVVLLIGLASAAPEGDAGPDPKADPQWWGGWGWGGYYGYPYWG